MLYLFPFNLDRLLPSKLDGLMADNDIDTFHFFFF